ncbi:MAG: galactokinase [Lachnospiraceae bacterium]|nr:galactokinase [Lachnospiraceae bacterium]
MKKASLIKSELIAGSYDGILASLYMDEGLVDSEKSRYVKAIDEFIGLFGDCEAEVYSAPGRSEVGGNHTDHENGMVLATSVNIDTIMVVTPTTDKVITVKSDGYDMCTADINTLTADKSEYGTTVALIRGVCASLKDLGYEIGGFKGYATSEVLSGSGLSSSAAFETLIGNVISGLYNNGEIDSVTIAKVGQKAENVFFGKPCGLMDQMACSVGGLISIDFEKPEDVKIEKVDVDFKDFGLYLCIVDTKGSHADLTDDYAAVPAEMKKIAAHFGKTVLREVEKDDVVKNLALLREKYGDRAVLRALHFYNEEENVAELVSALNAGDADRFLKTISISGDSSYKYLQNVYSTKKPAEQGLSLGIAVSEDFIKEKSEKGAVRVHGGGFAGTIQAFIPTECTSTYKETIEAVFGEGSCHILKVRDKGGIKVIG